MNAYRSHFIQGKWVKGSGSPLASINPATGQTVWQGYAATEQEVQLAVQAARKALFEWSNKDLADRIYHMHAFREALSHSKDLIAESISKETGKPLWESKTEVASMINKVAISIEAYGVRCPETVKDQPQGKSVTRHRPHGVLAVFGPFNFPGHLPNGHIVPALLAGNTVIFKPSELTPQTAEFMIECWQASELPPGVINLVQGGRETGQYLSQNDSINGLLFTGSWKTGQIFSEQFARTPGKMLALEMGGNNPLIVGEITDFKTASYLTIQSAFLTSGQRCTCARRLIVPMGAKGEAFLETLIAMMCTIAVGAYTEEPEPFMGPLINSSAAEKVLQAQERLLKQGGSSLLELKQLPKGPAFLSPGLVDVTAVEKREDEEIFGPLLQVIRVPNFEAGLKEANNTQYGLAAGLLSDREEEYHQFYQTVKAGVLNWNTQLTGASSAAPFGGIGRSGNNRPSAFYAPDYCAYPVASLESPKMTMPSSFVPGIKGLK